MSSQQQRKSIYGQISSVKISVIYSSNYYNVAKDYCHIDQVGWDVWSVVEMVCVGRSVGGQRRAHNREGHLHTRARKHIHTQSVCTALRPPAQQRY